MGPKILASFRRDRSKWADAVNDIHERYPSGLAQCTNDQIDDIETLFDYIIRGLTYFNENFSERKMELFVEFCVTGGRIYDFIAGMELAKKNIRTLLRTSMFAFKMTCVMIESQLGCITAVNLDENEKTRKRKREIGQIDKFLRMNYQKLPDTAEDGTIFGSWMRFSGFKAEKRKIAEDPSLQYLFELWNKIDIRWVDCGCVQCK